MEIKPYDLSLYDKVVQCHRYLNDLSKHKWRLLFLEMEKLVTSQRHEDVVELARNGSRTRVYIGGEMKFQELPERTGEVDVLDIFKDRRFIKLNPDENVYFGAKMSLNHTAFVNSESSPYNALFEAAEKAELYNKAFYYLEKRKNVTLGEIERAGGSPLDRTMSEELEKTKHTLKTFHADFWPKNRFRDSLYPSSSSPPSPPPSSSSSSNHPQVSVTRSRLFSSTVLPWAPSLVYLSSSLV